MTGAVLTVEKVNGYIQRIFESEELLHNILVAGEISNFSVSGTTAYFVLKDERASISCVCFDVRTKGGNIRSGDRVIVRGTPNFYTRLGKLSLIVSKISATTEQGLLFLKYAALKAKLEAEGLFDASKKRPLPRYPETIGVVTSRSGAVIHDIITVTRRRNPAVSILLSPVRVQGIGADEEIARGIRLIAKQNIDVLIVARGGGSEEDIEPFYSERVVRAVAECPVPVVSAVGHETDFSLCDYAADVRAATPSVAAELCVFSAEDYLAELRAQLMMCESLLGRRTERAKFELQKIAGDLTNRGSSLMIRNFNTVRNAVTGLYTGTSERYFRTLGAFETERSQIESLNPAEVLRRGFARVAKDGRIVGSAGSLSAGESVELIFADGIKRAKIKEDEVKS